MRSPEKPITFYLHCHSGYGHKILQGGNLPSWAPTHKIIWPFDHVVLWDHTTKKSHFISTTTVPMATKLSRVVSYLQALQTIKLYHAFITWSCKATWQSKTIIIQLPQCLCHQFWKDGKLSWWTPTRKSNDPLIRWSCEITWQTKTVIFPLGQCIRPPNLAGCWLTLWFPNHKVKEYFDNVVLQGHVKDKNHYTSVTKLSMATRPCKMVTYLTGSYSQVT